MSIWWHYLECASCARRFDSLDAFDLHRPNCDDPARGALFQVATRRMDRGPRPNAKGKRIRRPTHRKAAKPARQLPLWHVWDPQVQLTLLDARQLYLWDE